MAEKDKDGLENDKVEAETYLKLDAKCRAKSNVLYQVQRFRAVQNAEKVCMYLCVCMCHSLMCGVLQGASLTPVAPDPVQSFPRNGPLSKFRIYTQHLRQGEGVGAARYVF